MRFCIAPNRCLGPDKSCTQFQPRDTVDASPIAQTFVVGRTGRLVAVRLSLVCYEGQEVTLEIRRETARDPEGPLLNSQTVRGPVPPGDVFGEYWLIALASPVAVRAGDRLAMVVRFRGTSLLPGRHRPWRMQSRRMGLQPVRQSGGLERRPQLRPRLPDVHRRVNVDAQRPRRRASAAAVHGFSIAASARPDDSSRFSRKLPTPSTSRMRFCCGWCSRRCCRKSQPSEPASR